MKKIKLLFVLSLAFISNGLWAADKPLEELKQKYTTVNSHFIDIDGLPVHYQETGDKNKPTLILLHGVASSSHTWSGWHAALSNDFRVVSIDLPSFGLTGPFLDNAPLNADKYMRFIDHFADALQINRFHLAGNSFGGWLTWHYALHNPKRVNKIILLDAAGMAHETGHNPKSFKNNFGFALVAHPLTQKMTWRITPKFLIARTTRAMYADPSKVSPELITRYYDLLLRPGVRRAFSQVINMPDLELPDTSLRVAKITQPTLIMWGEQDKVLLPAGGQLFHKAILQSELISYPNAGHLPMEEIAEQTAQDARGFLQK